MKKVVVISAHPDDEILGCGGTLFKHQVQGDEIYWVITTNVKTPQFSEERVQSRTKEINEIKSQLGIKKIYQLNYLTTSLTDSSLLTMIPEISNAFNDCKPDIVYVLNRSDAHSDHLITFKSVLACTKSFRYPFIKQVLMYECLSETEFGPTLHENVFIPTYYVDISNYMEKKMKAMRVYESELGEHPFPRSEKNIKALATFRGATAGVEYAEAFQILKWIDK